MKLVRFGSPGKEKPGIVDRNGSIRDLSKLVPDITPDSLANGLIARVRKAKIDRLPLAPRGARLGPPVSKVRHFIAIGLNYVDHAEESGLPIPKEPIVFSKASNCIVGPNDEVVLPKGSRKTDWEVELALVIGKGGLYIKKADALSHVAGYTICNDVSEREYQLELGGSWTKGKGFPSFGPLGPWLVTRDEIRAPGTLDMFLEVNGKRMQTGTTSKMIFDVATIVSYVSRFHRLEAGDVITTGTPAGVGHGLKPKALFLKSGDTMRLGITGLGEQSQRVVRFR